MTRRAQSARGLIGWTEIATIGFVVAAMLIGARLHRPHAHAGTAGALHYPFFSSYHPLVTGWALISIGGLALCVVVAVRLPDDRRFYPAALFAVALASRVVVNIARHGPSELARPFTGPSGHDEYVAAVPTYLHDPLDFLRHFPDLIPTLPEHSAGHPAGATLIFGVLAQAGLTGAWPATIMILVVGAAAAPLTWLLAIRLNDRTTARIAALAWIFAPSVLLDEATSADAVFCTLAVATTLLLLAGHERLGAAAAALGVFLSYALIAVPIWASIIVLATRGRRPAIRLAILTAIAIVALHATLWLLFGYDPIASYEQTRQRYFAGVGSDRPYTYWVFANVAAFLLALGIPTMLGAVRGVHERATPALALAAIVLLATCSGYTKEEVERIWLFMTPFAAVAAAPYLRRLPPTLVVLVLAAQAVAVELLYNTYW